MKISSVSYNCNYKPGINRYYNPALSQWLSTGPLAEKYPGMSPYTYTADNPVMLTDPDGREGVTDFIDIETGERTHLEDGKDQVLAMTSSGMDYLQHLYDTRL